MRQILKISNLIILAVLFSCSDDNDAVEVQVDFPVIEGVWEWVGTIGGDPDTSDSPELSGVTRDIVITEDKFIFYRDEEILAERAYSFTYEVSEITGLEEFIVTFEDNGFRDIVRREDDFINFIDDCDNCYTSIYRLKD